jgi:hypothetical protein
MKRATVAIVALAMMTMALPTVAAQDVSVAGGCNDDGSRNDGGVTGLAPGGTVAPRATDTTDNDGDGGTGEEADVGATPVDVIDALDTANAVLYLAQGALWDGDGASNNCDGGGWIGVFGPANVCYDGGVNGADCQPHDTAGDDNTAPLADGD